MFQKKISLVPACAVLGIVLMMPGCGSKKAEDLKLAQARPAVPLNSAENSTSTKSFIIKDGDSSGDVILPKEDCIYDLKPEMSIDPLKGITVVYSEKADLKKCSVGGKKPVIYIKASGPFSMPSKFDCKIVTGDFTVRCTGEDSALKITTEGVVSLSINADKSFESSKIKFRVTFEN